PASEPIRVFLSLSLFGFDLSITSAVITIWTAAAIIFLITFLATRRPSIVPGKLQNFLELLYEVFEQQTKDFLKEESDKWLPFVFTIFSFILVSNLLGLIPNVYVITSNINVTATLAALVFLIYNLAGIKEHGLGGYFKAFIPKGVPIFIAPLLFVIEIFGQLARPFSLAIRLFANMTAGHLVAFTILSLIFVFKNIWIAGFPLLGRVAISLFEVFVALIQAYVFAYLAALYIGLAINEET
ncbi:MAG: F0F1 ATP synthase subunit A, partial [Candidatus Margulisbacteria bacterium]|nr:F0F1 ATP synthase subunit A [Candidatus Margulisiibacteriota bacterium]